MADNKLIKTNQLSARQINLRSSPFYYKTVKTDEVQNHQLQGWDLIPSKRKNSAKMKKLKPHDIHFEDRVWALFAKMGFGFLNSDKKFRLGYGNGLQKQIDVFAADNEAILIIECKSSEIRRKASFQKDIHEYIAIKEALRKSAQDLLPGKQKIAFILATHNTIISDNDKKRLEEGQIWHFNQDDIEYFEQLTDLLGSATKYQLFGKLFQGQKIPELKNKIPAVKSILGTHYPFYSFIVEPEFVLKIGFILHRTETNESSFQAYQRLVNKTRLKHIASFIDNGGYFPNSVIINFVTKSDKSLRFDQVSNIPHDSESKLGILHIPQLYKSAFIIDGQHRLYGYSKARSKSSHMIPVVAFHNLSDIEQTKIFVDINHTQKSVPANLLRSIMADFNWKSQHINRAMSALKTRILTDMDHQEKSPLYKRVIISEERKTATRCLTLQTVLNWGLGNKVNFFGEYKGNTLKPGFLTVFKNDKQLEIDYDHTLEKSITFFNECFRKFEENLKIQWDIGSGEGGFIAMNVGISAIFRVIDDILCYKFNSDRERTQKLAGEELAQAISEYLEPVIAYVKSLQLDEIKKFRGFFGSGAPEKVLRYFQYSIYEQFNDFNPIGLKQWISESSGKFNKESREIGHEIEKIIDEFIKDKLITEYGEKNWWRDGVPKKIQKDCAEKQIDLGSDQPPWRFLTTIQYYDIIKQNWELLGESFTPKNKGFENKAKDKRIEWLGEFNSIRQKYSHPQRENISEEEYNFLTEIKNWIGDLKLT